MLPAESFDEPSRAHVQEELNTVTQYLQRLANCRGEDVRSWECNHLQKAVQSLQKSAANSGMPMVAREAATLDLLLQELARNPGQLSGSRLRTLSLAVEVLGLLVRVPDPRQELLDKSVVVIVDAERVSSTAASNALRNAGLQPCAFQEPTEALTHLASTRADLIILDAATTSQGGMDVYNKVRELQFHRHTPVIFVTDKVDTKCPPGMLSNSHTQFLAKPHNMISYLELGIKALSRVLNFRVAKPAQAPAPLKLSPPAAPPSPPPVPERRPSEPDSPGTSMGPSQEIPLLMNPSKDPSTSIESKPNESVKDPGVESKVLADLKRRNQELEQELAGVWQMCEEIKREFAAEKAAQQAQRQHAPPETPKVAQDSAAEAVLAEVKKRNQELEQELAAVRQTCEEIKRESAAEKAAQQAQRQQAPPETFKAAQDSAAESQVVAELKKRNQELEQELAGVRQTCEEIKRESAAEKAAQQSQRQESAPSGTGESSDVDRRLRESAASCARVTADLEKERGERRRVEQRAAAMAGQLQELHGQLKDHFESESQSQKRISEFEQQLREREEALTRTRADLQKEKEERQLAEEQLRASSDLSVHLRNCLASFETAKQAFKRTQDVLDSRLQVSVKASAEKEARLQKEIAERQRTEEALRTLQAQTQSGALELARLQSALEVEQAERKCLESDAIQSRYASLDSARAGVTVGNKIRRQIQEPVDNLMQSTRRLLESSLDDDSKKLVESVLENALLLQSTLQDLGNSSTVPPNGPGSGETSGNLPSGGQNLAAA